MSVCAILLEVRYACCTEYTWLETTMALQCHAMIVCVYIQCYIECVHDTGIYSHTWLHPLALYCTKVCGFLHQYIHESLLKLCLILYTHATYCSINGTLKVHYQPLNGFQCIRCIMHTWCGFYLPKKSLCIEAHASYMCQ